MKSNMINSNYKDLNCEYRFSSFNEAIDKNQLIKTDYIDCINCLQVIDFH